MSILEKNWFRILRKITFFVIVLIIILTIGVKATKSDMNEITIVFPEGYETVVLTSKVKVSDILSENHILMMDDEKVYPESDQVVDFTKKITISKISEDPVVIAEEVQDVSTEEILGQYVTVTEKIITEQVDIPFETVTKDVSKAGSETKDTVLQEGQNGLKELKYKVKYQDNVEIERTLISETVIKEPVQKIVQISTKITSRGANRKAYSADELKSSVEGMTPTVVNMNTSAYCSCKICTGKTNGVTSSGAVAKEWYTVAAGSAYPIGTVIYIPALSSKPNGGWFVVEDRGGAISNNRIDIYLGSHQSAINFGRKSLQVYVYK